MNPEPRRKGTLTDIVTVAHADAGSQLPDFSRKLLSPETLTVSYVEIQAPRSQAVSVIAVYGAIPDQYLGTPVRLHQSQRKLNGSSFEIKQELYAGCNPVTYEGGRKIVDATVRLRS
jgi:hypothetical protein